MIFSQILNFLIFNFSKKINEKTPPTSPSTPATTPSSGHMRRWVYIVDVESNFFHLSFLKHFCRLNTIPQFALGKREVSRSRRQNRKQLWTRWSQRIRISLIWSRVAIARHQTRWKMPWRIRTSLRMLAKMSHLKCLVRRRRDPPSPSKRQPLRRPQINSRPETFSKTSSSKFSFDLPHIVGFTMFSFPLWD